jgi:hypothetical protein
MIKMNNLAAIPVINRQAGTVRLTVMRKPGKAIIKSITVRCDYISNPDGIIFDYMVTRTVTDQAEVLAKFVCFLRGFF